MEKNDFGKIGGTTVSAIVGQNPWETPYSAYLKLRREVDDTPDNTAMARGRRYEPIVADIFAGGHPEYRIAHNRKGTDAPECYVHEKYSFLVGHPDRLLYDADSDKLVAGLEIKTSNWANSRLYGEEGTDAIPAHYLIQCQWYAGLAKLPVWRVAVAFLDDDGILKRNREFTVIADAELFDALVERAVDFYENNVLTGTPPKMTTVDETTKRWIEQRYPQNVEPIESATPQEEQVMARYIARKDAFDAAQRELEEAEAALKLAIGARDGLESESFGKVTWRRQKDSKRVNYHGIVNELKPPEELVEQYTKTIIGTRRLITTGLRVNLY